MSVSRETLDRLEKFCASRPHRGDWLEFCQREGIHYQTLHYWRLKLGLWKLAYPKRKKIMNVGVTIIST